MMANGRRGGRKEAAAAAAAADWMLLRIHGWRRNSGGRRMDGESFAPANGRGWGFSQVLQQMALGRVYVCSGKSRRVPRLGLGLVLVLMLVLDCSALGSLLSTGFT